MTTGTLEREDDAFQLARQNARPACQSPPQMDQAIERDLGEQPVARLLTALGLKPHDLVAASTEQITHKMVARACKGRRLTPNVQAKIRRALHAASGQDHPLAELFNY